MNHINHVPTSTQPQKTSLLAPHDLKKPAQSTMEGQLSEDCSLATSLSSSSSMACSLVGTSASSTSANCNSSLHAASSAGSSVFAGGSASSSACAGAGASAYGSDFSRQSSSSRNSTRSPLDTIMGKE